MAQFWIPSARSAEVAWALRPLAGAAYQLLPAAPFLRPIAATAPPPGAAILLRVPADANAERWLLLVAPGADVRVNGLPTPPGPRVIEDHDELRVAAGPRLYFSTERLPQVVPFPGADHVVYCARCRSPIEPGTPAVCCPSCGCWCHQSAQYPCWHYEGTTHCPLCDQSNDPDAHYRWSPEELTYER